MKETRHSSRHKPGPPPAKKARLSSHVKREETPATSSPAPTVASSAQQDTKEPEITLLPHRVYHSRPLPTLPELQPTTLPQDEYQSIEGSGILLASLERSRQKWLSGEFFERYWVKTTASKKDQKNSPSNNPPKAWMKEVGRCTIIAEPSIFEANVYISKDPSIITATQQQNTMLYQQQQQYRPPGSQQYQNQPRPFAGSPPAPNSNQRPITMNGHSGSQPSNPPAPAPKQSPDPVIQLLASRASQDRDLKELMKIVATGSAAPEQLKAFQKHIDELNAVVAAQNAAAENSQHQQPRPGMPAPIRQIAPVHSNRTDLLKAPFPVVLEFLDSGASPDRFLFPPYSIVEALGNYSILASFMVIRKGSEASASSVFDPDTEYYEPVTIKIDVAPGTRSVEVLDHMKRGVKPAEEVRRWMEEQIRTKKRAPMRYLPLKLPIESQLPPEEQIIEETPPPVEAKKRGPYKKKADREREQQEAEQLANQNKEKDVRNEQAASSITNGAPVAGADADAPEGGRRSSRRTTRLSTSITA